MEHGEVTFGEVFRRNVGSRRGRLAVSASGAAMALAAAGLFTTARPTPSRCVPAVGPSPWDGFRAPTPTHPHTFIDRNVPIRMDDGVIIRADVWYPADENRHKAPGQFPVIVVSHCYGKSLLGAMVDYTKYGYVVVVADSRGTGSSAGKFGILDDREARDAYDIVEWAGTQPFSTGKVGVEGFSYLGASSAMTAATRPPHLAAANFGGAPTDTYRTFLAQGGNAASSAVLWFFLELLGAVPMPFTMNMKDGLQIVWKNPLSDLFTFIGRLLLNGNSILFRVRQLVLVLAEKSNWANDFWQERSSDISKVEVPTLVYSGWADLFLRDTPRDFRSLPMDISRKKMVIGPWTHYSLPKHIGVNNDQHIDDVLIGWFDRWLKGIDNGIDRIDPVLLWEYSSEKWVGHKSWPVEDTQYERLYLSGVRSGTSKSVNDGSLSVTEPERDSVAAMRVGPIKGIRSRQTMQFLGGLPVYLPLSFFVPKLPLRTLPFIDRIAPGFRVDDRKNERGALTFTTSPVVDDIVFTGTVALTLRGSTTAADPVWVARLSDVGPDGKARPIGQGALVASRRALDPARTHCAPNGDVVEPFHWHTKDTALPVVPGETETYNVEIWPTSWLIRQGHRLRLTIDGAEFPHLIPTAATPKRLGSLTVHFGPQELSFLSMPVQRGAFG